MRAVLQSGWLFQSETRFQRTAKWFLLITVAVYSALIVATHRCVRVRVYICVYMRVPVILFSHKLVLEGTVVLGWADRDRVRRPRSRIELANRICMEQVVTIPGHDSGRSGRPDLSTAFPFLSFASHISAARRFVFPRWDPQQEIAESSPSHTYARTRTSQLPRSSTIVFSELFRRRDCDVVKRSRTACVSCELYDGCTRTIRWRETLVLGTFEIIAWYDGINCTAPLTTWGISRSRIRCFAIISHLQFKGTLSV